MKIAHLIGNGPSRSAFRNEPEGDAYGCNLSDFTLDLKATFIMDFVVFERIMKDGLVLPWPIICAETIKRHVRSLPPGNVLLDVVGERAQPGESTGHYAFQYLVREGYDEIHLWGFDSITRGTIESDSHLKIPEGGWSPGNVPIWQSLWGKLIPMAESNGVKVMVHPPVSE